MDIYSQSYDLLKSKGFSLYRDATSTNCGCYKKLRLAAVVAAAAAKTLAATMAAAATVFGGYTMISCSALHKQFLLGVWGKSQLCFALYLRAL